MSNFKLLGLMRVVDFLEEYVIECRNQFLEMPYGEERSRLEDATNTKIKRIKIIQQECTHPIGVKVGANVYCPICEKELSPESVIITVEREASGQNIGFIREKLAEVLPLIPEVTPIEMVDYINRELKEFNR